MSATVDQFGNHLDECEKCGSDGHGFRFCPEGRDLLFEAAEELPPGWQEEARRIQEREYIEREAEANFRFYANSEEF